VDAKKPVNGMRVRRDWEVSMGALFLKLLWMMRGCLLVARNNICAAVGNMVLQTMKQRQFDKRPTVR
jgi:hypothetical protein